jgi:hypothetical protein
LIEREKIRPNWRQSSIVMFIVHSYDTIGQVVEMGLRTPE